MRALSTIMLLVACMVGAFAVDMPNPLADAKVGEWVTYSMQNNMKQTQKITAVSASEISLSTEMVMGETKLPAQVTTIPLGGAAGQVGAAGQAPKMSEETLTIAGKSVKCVVIESEAGGMKSKTWMSNDVPVNGIVKVVSNGQVVMELTDFGTK